MSLRLVILGGLAFALVACGGNLPNSAISRHLAGRYAGALTDSTAVPTVIRDRGIKVPDIDRPMLEQLRTELAKSDPDHAFAGITYDLTTGNTLPPNWIVQTPNAWGLKANALPKGHSDFLPQLVHDLIASARQRVDVSLLQPAPDGAFREAIRQALQELAQRGRPIQVRFIIGQYPPDNVDVPAFYKALTEGLDLGRLNISVAAYRSCVALDDCDSYSWNHSKIVAVDGAEILAGGHNQWDEDYLRGEPVSDLSLHVKGPVAASAVRFIDRLWEYVCANVGKNDSIALESSTGSCPAPAALPMRRGGGGGGGGSLPILSVARLGAGITTDYANQSELARDLSFAAARHEIRIAQQDLGFGLGRADTLFPDSTIDRLIDFLRQGRGDIYIVLSNLGAKGKSGSTYSNDVTLMTLARHLKQEVQRRFDAHDPKERYEIRRGPDPVNAMLCEHVHLAPFRFGPDGQWPGGAPFATHAKFWMVDGRVFYVGSDNMYPVNLQEFGYIIDDAKAAQEIGEAYWAHVWEWSSKAAVSGPEVKDCIFREAIK